MSNKRILLAAVMLLMMVAACQSQTPPPAPAPTQAPGVAFTQAAQTIVAQLTLAAPTATEVPPAVVPIQPTAPPAPTMTKAPTVPPPNSTPPPASLPPTSTSRPNAPQSSVPQIPITPLAPFMGDVGGGSGVPVPTSAVTPPAAVVTQTFQTTPLPDADYRLVLKDPFNGIYRFWHTQSTPDWSLSYTREGYRIYSNVLNDTIWSVRTEDYADVRLEVDAARQSGPSSGFYGITCRFQNGGYYYGLVVSSDGNFGILKKSAGKLKFIKESTSPTALFAPGENFSQLRADCVGKTLSLYINGKKVIEAQDDEFKTGGVGVLAGNRKDTGIVALFRNFVIMVPLH